MKETETIISIIANLKLLFFLSHSCLFCILKHSLLDSYLSMSALLNFVILSQFHQHVSWEHLHLQIMSQLDFFVQNFTWSLYAMRQTIVENLFVEKLAWKALKMRVKFWRNWLQCQKRNCKCIRRLGKVTLLCLVAC